jgi:uncharacterized delta-60 repeat protein
MGKVTAGVAAMVMAGIGTGVARAEQDVTPFLVNQIGQNTRLDQLASGEVLATSGGLAAAQLDATSARHVAGPGPADAEEPYGDGGPATASSFGAFSAAGLPDGGYLIADTLHGRVRRVSAEGVINTVMGGGALGAGCPADGVDISNVTSVEPLPDGGFLATDHLLHVTYRRWPNGMVTQVMDFDPTGMSLDASGHLLFTGGSEIFRLGADGSRQSVAGYDTTINATRGGFQIGDAADVAGLSDGGFLVADVNNNRVVRYYADGWAQLWVTESSGLADPRYLVAMRDGDSVISDSKTRLLHVHDGLRPAAPAEVHLPGPVPSQEPTGDCRWIDTGFGRGGSALLRGIQYPLFRSPTGGVTALPDGRIAVAGPLDADHSTFALAVVRPDGSPDTGFGPHGTRQWTVGAQSSTADEVLPQAGGKLLLVGDGWPGTSGWGVALLRVAANGDPDPSYGNGGQAFFTDPRSPALYRAASAAPDGSVYVLYAISDEAGGVARVDPSGALDQGFADHGLWFWDRKPYAIAATGDGGLLVLGQTAEGHNTLTRLDAAGRPVAAFGAAGTVDLTAPQDPVTVGFIQLAAGPGDRITLAGVSRTGDQDDLAVRRLLANGRTDATFGDAGTTIVPAREIPGLTSVWAGRPSQALVEPGGQVDVVSQGAAVIRLLADGRLDRAFGEDGMESVPRRPGGPAAWTDRGVVLASRSWNSYIEKTWLVRFTAPAQTAPPSNAPPAQGSPPAQPPATTSDPPRTPDPPAGDPVVQGAEAPAAPAKAKLRVIVRRAPWRKLHRSGVRVQLSGASGLVRLALRAGRRTIVAATVKSDGHPLRVVLHVPRHRPSPRLTLVVALDGKVVRRLAL